MIIKEELLFSSPDKAHTNSNLELKKYDRGNVSDSDETN
jgi:hypothetical protein